MCILIACPPDTTPDLTDLWDATDQNPDGHGWAIRHDGTIERMVSVDADRALSTFLAARERWPGTWALWHSRFATQGVRDTTNCQPLIVPGTGWVMGHNGILPFSDGPLDNRRSDSRILAEDHLPTWGWKDLRLQSTALDAWLSPSKVVIMSPRKEKGGPVIILGEKRGTWAKDGCWWSSRPYVMNAAWKQSSRPLSAYLTDEELARWDDEEGDVFSPTCDVCHETYGDCDCPDPDWAHEEDDAYQTALRALTDR